MSRFNDMDLGLEARGGIEPPIMVLQTIALPLGDRAAGGEDLRGEDRTDAFALSSYSVLHQQTLSALLKDPPVRVFSRDRPQPAAAGAPTSLYGLRLSGQRPPLRAGRRVFH